jgi:transposase InsO family protein
MTYNNRRLFQVFIKTKEAQEVVGHIIELQAWFQRQSGNLTKVIRSDRGREFLNNMLDRHCRDKGIRHEASTAQPEQNGIAERLHRTFMEKVKAQLKSSRMDKEWWGNVE